MNILKKFLGFDAKSMTLKTEFVAGVTIFLTMSYILAVNPAILSTTGMDKGALFTGTAIASAIATILLAVMAKLPFAQSCSMGLNAFFAYTLCLTMGYSWQQALAILLIEGLIFIIITFFNVREKILYAIPLNLRYAISVGIGMFIAFIGLKNAGIIVANEGTLVGLGNFTPTMMLGLFAIVLSGVLMARKVKGFDFNGLISFQTAIVVFVLLLVNIFDTIGTIVGLAEKTGIVEPDGKIPHASEAMMSDAIGTTCGAILGTSTITTYIESAIGIAEGGRSGVAAFVTGILFLLSLFLSPVFLIIPSAATSGALVMVGVLMIESVKKIDLSEIDDAFAAFITIITTVLCYSISDGIILGILSYVIMKVCTGKFKDLNSTLVILSIIFILSFIFK